MAAMTSGEKMLLYSVIQTNEHRQKHDRIQLTKQNY